MTGIYVMIKTFLRQCYVITKWTFKLTIVFRFDYCESSLFLGLSSSEDSETSGAFGLRLKESAFVWQALGLWTTVKVLSLRLATNVKARQTGSAFEISSS